MKLLGTAAPYESVPVTIFAMPFVAEVCVISNFRAMITLIPQSFPWFILWTTTHLKLDTKIPCQWLSLKISICEKIILIDF